MAYRIPSVSLTGIGVTPTHDPILQGVYVVIAAYNEAGVIGEVVDGVGRYVGTGRVIVVDDGSDDGTGDSAAGHEARVVRHLVNRGQGAALATGIHAALRLGAEVIVTFDADGQHDPADLPKITEPVLAGRVDIVLGTRFGHDGPPIPALRRLLLKAGVAFTRITSRVKITDAHNGYRALSRDAAERIRIRRDRMEHASEILDEIKRHRLRYEECPVSIRYTAYSLGKGQKNRDVWRLLLRILYYKAGR